jgi:hypothetical protein
MFGTVGTGSFDKIDNIPRPSLARLNRNGSLDLTFDPAIYDIVAFGGFVLQPDETLIVSGQNANFNFISLHLDLNDGVQSTLSDFIPQHALLRTDGTYIVGDPFDATGLISAHSHLLCWHQFPDASSDDNFKFNFTATTVIRGGSSDPSSAQTTISSSRFTQEITARSQFCRITNSSLGISTAATHITLSG